MAAQDYIPLNLAILSRWQNWVIIILVVYLAGLALALITTPVAQPEKET